VEGDEGDEAYGSLVALAAALNALDVDVGRLWDGPWRWQSAHLLHMVLPAGAAPPASEE
jgi:hypothetical protein